MAYALCQNIVSEGRRPGLQQDRSNGILAYALSKANRQKDFPLSLDLKEREQALLVCHGGTY